MSDLGPFSASLSGQQCVASKYPIPNKTFEILLTYFEFVLYLCLAPSVRLWLKPQKLTNPLESKQPMLGRNLGAVLVLER